MRYLLAAGAWLAGLAVLFPACSVEDHAATQGDVEAAQGVAADALVVPSGDEEGHSCLQVDRWIEANRAKLPTDYDGLGRLPIPYRQAVFGALPPATRSALFREQYARYTLAHPDMTAAQRAVIERATALMTPDVYALPQESPEWAERVGAPQQELERQARAAFSHDEVGRIFASIGPEDPPDPPHPLALMSSTLPTCDCNTVSVWCSGNKKCTTGIVKCIYLNRFCGWTLLMPCNGFCTG